MRQILADARWLLPRAALAVLLIFALFIVLGLLGGGSPAARATPTPTTCPPHFRMTTPPHAHCVPAP